MNEQMMWYAAFAAGIAAVLPRAVRRAQLSLAKHPSLAGHPRMSRRLARMLPYYEYDEADFFGVDGVSSDVVERRRAAFERLSACFGERYVRTARLTAECRDAISDLRFTSTYRVPFQFSRLVRERLRTGVFVSASDRCIVEDLDGNRFYDLTGSYGVNVFGYEFYKQCMDEGAARVRSLGPVLGAYHPAVAENAARLTQLSGLDEVSFHMSGTEAVMQAVRLARYHTGRSHLLRFSGAYHGWWEDVQPGVGTPLPPHETYTLRDMDDSTLRILRTRNDIACVLVNPLQALHPNAGAPGDSSLIDGVRTAGFDRDAYTDWLRKLRAVCSERGIVLIFDEVFVGFRLARGGAQEYFGVKADMVTYGKTLGGGFPVGVLCGRADLMKRFRDTRPADICFARGTFNSHPWVMGAMQVFLQRLDTPEVAAIYEGLDARWNERATGFNAALAAEGVPIRIANLSSIWTVCFTTPGRYHWMLQFYLKKHGLALSWVGSGRLIFSLDYTDEDIAEVRTRFVAAVSEMREDGWLEAPAGVTSKSIRRQVMRESARQATREFGGFMRRALRRAAP